jgi:hypothetical protein
MAFADSGTRTCLFGFAPVTVTMTGAVEEGDVVGYSSGWQKADGSPTIAAGFVAAKTYAAGDEGVMYAGAVIDGFTGATPGASLYIADAAGHYSDSAGSYSQVVGLMATDTMAVVFPSQLLGVTIGDASVTLAKLVNLTSTYMIVGSSGNIPTAREITGDVTVGNTGTTTIGSGKVHTAMIVAANLCKTLVSPVQNIDTGNGVTYDYCLMVPSTGIEITEVRIVYDEAASGTCAAGNWSVGTSAVTGVEIVSAQALENSKAVGYAKVCTLVEGTVAADTPIFARYTGVATTVNGATHLEVDYYCTE